MQISGVCTDDTHLCVIQFGQVDKSIRRSWNTHTHTHTHIHTPWSRWWEESSWFAVAVSAAWDELYALTRLGALLLKAVRSKCPTVVAVLLSCTFRMMFSAILPYSSPSWRDSVMIAHTWRMYVGCQNVLYVFCCRIPYITWIGCQSVLYILSQDTIHYMQHVDRASECPLYM